MSFSGPVALILGPLLAAAATLTMCRWRRLVAAAGATLAGLLWLWLRLAPLDEQTAVFLVYGRSLTLTEGIRALFLLLLAGSGALFLLSMALPQSRYFVPAVLAVLAPLAAMLMIRPLAFGALFWLMAAALLAVLLQSGRAGTTNAAQRYLLMAVLTAPLFLVAGWMLETGPAAPSLTAGRALALAFIILLAGFPFHIWLQPLVTEASPVAVLFVLGLAQMAVTLFVTNWLLAYPWLQEEPAFMGLIRWSSGLTALTAGLLALTAVNYGRLIGSLLLLDMSVSLALLLVPARVGLETAVLLPMVRFMGLLLVTMGLSRLDRYFYRSEFTTFRGLARQNSLETALFALGIASLLGLPLAVGFSGRWAALAHVAQQPASGPGLPVALLLAMGGGIYGAWRGLAPMLALVEVASNAESFTELAWMRLAMAAGLAGGLALAVWPQMISSFANHLADLWLSAG